jgi:hypothetical protein
MNDVEGGSKDIYALLSARRPEDRVAAVAKAALSQHSPSVECPLYFAALNTALRKEPPPFGTDAYADIYRAASADGQWMAISLITNAEREGDGAKRLWSLAACCDDAKEQQLLKRHAVDESRHALAYLALLDLSFPDAVAPAFRSQLNALSPGYAMEQQLFAVQGSPYAKAPTIDDYLQMNIAEIRTAIHHIMQRPALAALCPADNLRRTTSIQEALLRDELHHVAYTAVLIERKARDAEPNEISKLFCKRFSDFNNITSEEAIEFTYHQRFGNYP